MASTSRIAASRRIVSAPIVSLSATAIAAERARSRVSGGRTPQRLTSDPGFLGEFGIGSTFVGIAGAVFDNLTLYGTVADHGLTT